MSHPFTLLYLQRIYQSRAFRLIAQTVYVIILAYADQTVGSPQILVSTSPLSKKIEQPTVTALLRDHNGILWIGTQHGLYRFDGIHFSKFGSEMQGENYIPTSYIEEIVEYSNRRIVVATLGGGGFIFNLEKTPFTQLFAATT